MNLVSEPSIDISNKYSCTYSGVELTELENVLNISLQELEQKIQNGEKLKYDEVKKYIYGLHELHWYKNDIIKLDQAPNENIIYHLYCDGEITSQKGSYAYGSRTEFPYQSPFMSNTQYFVFPCKRKMYTYAVLTEEECVYCAKLMKECV